MHQDVPRSLVTKLLSELSKKIRYNNWHNIESFIFMALFVILLQFVPDSFNNVVICNEIQMNPQVFKCFVIHCHFYGNRIGSPKPNNNVVGIPLTCPSVKFCSVQTSPTSPTTSSVRAAAPPATSPATVARSDPAKAAPQPRATRPKSTKNTCRWWPNSARAHPQKRPNPKPPRPRSRARRPVSTCSRRRWHRDLWCRRRCRARRFLAWTEWHRRRGAPWLRTWAGSRVRPESCHRLRLQVRAVRRRWCRGWARIISRRRPGPPRLTGAWRRRACRGKRPRSRGLRGIVRRRRHQGLMLIVCWPRRRRLRRLRQRERRDELWDCN